MKLKTKKIIIALFICFLMVTSIAGFIAISEEDNSFNQEKKYFKEREFVRENDRWTTDFNGNKISILINPELLREEAIDFNKLRQSEKVYVSLNPKNDISLIGSEINLFLQMLNKKLILSCYEDSEECKNLPLRTCKDATSLNNVILVKLNNQSKFEFNQNCLQIEGSEKEIATYVDSLIVSLLG